MAQKLALFLTVLAVSCITINAGVSGTAPSSNFNVTPVTVIDNSTDSGFVNYTAVEFVPGFDNTTIFVYAYNLSSAAVTFNRRSINASTLATINGSDSKISTTIPTNGSYVTAAGTGYLGVASIYNSTASTYQDLSVSYTAVNGSFSTVKVTSNADYNITYSVASFWYDTNYFWVVYVQNNQTSGLDLAAYIQAVKVTDGSKLYTAPVKVATLNQTSGMSNVMAGPTNQTNSSTINVLYKTNVANSTYYVTFTVNGSGTVGSPVTLFTDASNITYAPAGTLGSFSTSGVFVTKKDNSTGTLANSTYGFYNGNTTAVLVAGSTMSGYAAPYVSGSNFVSGYALFELYPSATGGDTAYYLDYYFANQTRNGSAQVSVGTYGAGLETFQDANGAVWGGYYSTDSNNNGFLVKAYVGKLIAQVNAGASVLSGFLAFISLMIAALFAF